MTSKKNKNHLPHNTEKSVEIATEVAISKEETRSKTWLHFLKEDWIGLVLLILSIIGAYIMSIVGDGFYQGEEAHHYVNMKSFWDNPNVILGAAVKTGYKILFVIPAYFGQTATRITQCIVVGLIAYFTYRVAKIKKLDYPFLAFFLFASACLWTGVSYRYYPEVLGALLLILALFLYYQYPKSIHWAAMVFGYLLIVRGEMMFVAVIFFAYLVFKKEWKAILFMGIFPFLYNLWGFIVHGDLLFMINSQSQYAAQVKNSYQKAGFDHYFLMSGIIFGYISVIGSVLYLVFCVIRKIKVDWMIVIPFAVFFFVQCLINWKERNILTSTGGNIRYMMSISPLVVLMAMMGFQKLFEIKNRFLYLFFLVPIIAFIGYAQTYDHNWIERAKWLPRDFTPLYFAAPFALFLVLPIRNKHVYFSGIILAAIVSTFLFMKPIKLIDSGENHTAKEIVDWVKKNNFQDTRTIYQNLPTFNYFFDRTPEDYKMGNFAMNEDVLEKSKVGSIVIWDSHFAQKFSKVEKKYFDERPNKYLLLDQKLSPDRRVEFYIYERINN